MTDAWQPPEADSKPPPWQPPARDSEPLATGTTPDSGESFTPPEENHDETAGRVGGLAARAGLSGVADLAGLPHMAAEGIRSLADPGGVAIDRMTQGADTRPYKPDLSDFVHPEKWAQAAHYFADKASDKAGFATPSTPAERIGSKAVEALPSVVLAPEAPIAGGLSAMAGGASAQGAAEMKLGPIAQTIAGLIGGSAGAAGAGGAETIRRIARGGAEGQAATQARLADAAASGTTLDAGQATGSHLLQYLSGMSSKLWGGAPINKLVDEQTKGIGSHVQGIVDNLSGGNTVSPTSAGNAIIKGIGDRNTEGSTLGNMHAAEKAAYDHMDTLIPPDHPFDISSTLEKLDKLASPTPGATSTTGALIPAKIKSIRDNLQADLRRNAERGAPRPADIGMGPAPATPVNTAPRPAPPAPPPDTTGMSGLGVTPAPRTSLAPEPVTRPAAWDQPVQSQPLSWRDKPAFAGTGVTLPPPPPVLPYHSVRSLRTAIGNSIDRGFSPSDPVSNGALKQLYGALSTDLKAGAVGVSPKAAEAAESANSLYAANKEREEQLESILAAKGGPENVYQAATNGTKLGATKINQVMGALAPDHQNLVRATVLDRLGRATAGAQNAEGTAFSPGTFLTNWSKMDPDAKTALFGASGTPKTLRSNLDSLTNTISNIRSGTKLRNPSGTGEAVGHYGGAIALFEGLRETLSGHPTALATTAAGIGLNNILARALTNPKTVAWLAKSTKAPVSSLPNAVHQLSQMDDPDAQALAAHLTPEETDRPARASGGAVNEDALVDRLMKRWKDAKRATDASTKPLLRVPDEAIVHALNISKAGL